MKNRNQGGFSLIDVVVTVAIIVALSVGGFVSYNGIVANAKQGAVDYAASNVYKGAVVYESDSDPATNACTAVDEFNASSSGITVELRVPETPGATAPEDLTFYYGAGNPYNTYNCL